MLWKTKKDKRIEYLEGQLEYEREQKYKSMMRNATLREKIMKIEDDAAEKPVASNVDLSSPIFQRIIKAGRNALVKKAHPDHGGSREQLEEIEKAFEILKTVKLSYESQQDIMARAQRESLYRSMAAQQNMNNGWWR